MGSNSQRVTHKQIARLAGVHRATVSLALKKHPSIPKKTQDRIQEIADRLGYCPDPMLSALSAYRMRQRPEVFHGTLAWLGKSEGKWNWHNQEVYCEYFEGAKARAKAYGYELEEFDLGEKNMTPERMASIFQARNIPGLVVCPQPNPKTELSFAWDKFSAVALGYTLVKPQLHTVAASQYRIMLQLMHKMYELGYKRIGVVYSPTFNERTNYHYMAGILIEQYKSKIKSPVPFLECSIRTQPECVLKWFKRYKPDVIVTGDTKIIEILASLGISVPDDVSTSCLIVPTHNEVLSGMCENPHRIGSVAIDFLVAMINRGERGIPDIAQRVHVEAVWKQGKTLSLAPSAR